MSLLVFGKRQHKGEMVLRLLSFLFKFTGVYWFFIAISPFLIAEFAVGYYPARHTFGYLLRDIMIYLSYAMIVLTTIQNLIRLAKPDFRIINPKVKERNENQNGV
jgi:hypothetical protein